MACTSLVNIANNCERRGIMGGISTAYMMSVADTYSWPGYANGNIYTISEAGYVDSINVIPGKFFVEIGLLKATSGIGENGTANINGGFTVEQIFTLVLAEINAEVTAWIDNIISQPVIVIVKTITGKYFAAGLNQNMMLASIAGGTGINFTDLNGYTLTFSAIEGRTIRPVLPTLIPEITVPEVVDEEFQYRFRLIL